MRTIFLGAIMVVLFFSCTRDNVDMPSFDVSTSSLSYKAGDTIRFEFAGNPDNVTFFSGEPGKQYRYKDRVSEQGQAILKFTSYAQYLTSDNEFKILVSTNFTGATDSANIRKATWTDITGRAMLSTGTDNTASGNIDLSEFSVPDVPVTVAFMYKDKPKASSSQRQATWTIKNLTLTNQLTDGTVSSLVTMAMNTWGKFSFANAVAGWTSTTTQVQMAGGTYTSPENEDWLLFKTVDLSFVKADAGVAIKNTSIDLPKYTYRYLQPGSYTAVFEASNVNYKGQKNMTKEIALTITP